MLNPAKINITGDKNIIIQLDNDRNYTVDQLSVSVRDLFKSKDSVYFSTNDGDILGSNCKIVDLIILNPKKYKNLKIVKSIDSISDSNRAENKLYTSYKPYEDNMKFKKFEELDVKPKKEVESNYDLPKYSSDSNLKNDNDYNFKTLEKYKDIEYSTKFFDKYKKEDIGGTTTPSEIQYDKKKIDASPNRFINTNSSIEAGNNYMTITDNMNPDKKLEPNYNIGSPSVSFNYTDRLKDEFNQQRQRFASEKRTYTRGAETKEQQPSTNYEMKYSIDKAKAGEIKREFSKNAEGIKRPIISASTV